MEAYMKCLENLELSDNDLLNFKLQGRTLLSHPDKVWQQADTNTKKFVFNFVFEENLKVKEWWS